MNKQNTQYWVAFSGGLDSCVLLHFLAKQFPKFSLKAIHINHQLMPQATQWADHCQQFCDALKIPLIIIPITLNLHSKQGLEATARDARYAAIAEIISPGDIIFTAHHQDDQAETVLLQLFRGAGLKGVSAMQKISFFKKQSYLIRPLLTYSHDDLLYYAEINHLHWIDDPSNIDQKFDRNYLRQTILPLLKNRWPQINKTLSRFAMHCAEQEAILDIIAGQDYQVCLGEYPNALFIPALQQFDKSRRLNILRHWIHQANVKQPAKIILNEIVNNLCCAKQDANPIVRWPSAECRRYQQHLFLLNQHYQRSSELTPEEKNWCEKNLDFKLDFADKSLEIRFRQYGERFRPRGATHTRTLKNLFQEWHVPPWLRDQIPLLYKNNQLIAVIGYAI